MVKGSGPEKSKDLAGTVLWGANLNFAEKNRVPTPGPGHGTNQVTFTRAAVE